MGDLIRDLLGRWALNAARWRITLQRRIYARGADSRPIWYGYSVGSYYTIGIHPRWRCGYDHFYYDGDHHAIHLGRLFIAWGS